MMPIASPIEANRIQFKMFSFNEVNCDFIIVLIYLITTRK